MDVYIRDYIIIGEIPKTYQIYVADDNSNEILTKDIKFVTDEIRKLRNYYKNVHKENINLIDYCVIKPLWRELNKLLIEPFAKVNNGTYVTVHKS